MSDTNEALQNPIPQENAGYLMAYDKKDKKARGVTGIDAGGNLTTEEAQAQNVGKFMKIDMHGNILSNFSKNFMHGFKNPLRFDFYKIPQETKPETAAEQIETGRESQDETVRKNLGQNRIYNDHRFNECEIDWEQAERFGITKEGLEFNNTLETLLKGEQSATTFRISKESELGRDRGDAKLSLFRKEDGSVKFDLHFIRRAIKEGEEYRGYKFTGEDIHNLNTTGNLGHTPNLTVDYSTGETKPCYISKDPVTHEIFHLTKEYANLIHQVKDYRLTQSEFADYEAGKEVGPITFTSANGKAVTTSIQMSALKRGTEYLFERSTKLSQQQKDALAEERKNRQSQSEGQRKNSNSIKPRL